MTNEEKRKNYEDQILKMIGQLRDWRRTHGHIEVMVRFLNPPSVMVISPLNEAINQKIVLVNAAGQRMLQELGWLDGQVTVFQTQLVIKHVDDADAPASSEEEETDPISPR